MRANFICCLYNVVALSMLDEFAFMRRKEVLILVCFHVLEIFSAKCCNFSIYLCSDAFLDS